jgi:Tfp pilus assembly protein PilX
MEPTFKMNSKYKQNGAVLVVSLLLLLVLTVIGVTGLSNTNLEERMSGNFHHTTLVYQSAESALEQIYLSSNPETTDNPFYTIANDPMISAINAGEDPDDPTVVSATFNGDLKSASLSTSTTVLFDGMKNCPETTFGEVICSKIQARAQADITATNTTATHVLGMERAMPGNQNTKDLIN